MRFLLITLLHTGRNMLLTWKSQCATLFTVTLSVLIFSFFYLIYTNVMQVSAAFNDDLRLIAYLDEPPSQPMQEQYRTKILRFDRVDKIVFVSPQEAYQRFEKILGKDKDVLSNVPNNFLPASIEVYPIHSLDSLARIKRFSDYLQTLPGVVKVQYGQEWIDRFHSFVQLMRVVVFLSGALLVMTTTFMVAHTIRLTLHTRQQELELLRLVGATNEYISMPYLMEGLLQGVVGGGAGILALLLLFNWIKLQFAGPHTTSLTFTFFSWPSICLIICLAALFCVIGSFSSIRRFLRI